MPPRQRNIRKRKIAEDAEHGQEEDSGLPLRERLEAAKALQKQRARPSGVDPTAVRADPDALAAAPAEGVGMVAAQALDRAHEAQAQEGGMLGTFSKERTTDAVELDPNMQAYVEEQMAKRLGVKKAEGSRAMLRDPEQQLYVTPDELKIDAIKPQEVPGSWLTGITEVQLPAHFKLKNIEETEAAKKRLLGSEDEDSEGGRWEEQRGLPRGAFPRGFGRENEKVAAVRRSNLVRQTVGPTQKEKRARAR